MSQTPKGGCFALSRLASHIRVLSKLGEKPALIRKTTIFESPFNEYSPKSSTHISGIVARTESYVIWRTLIPNSSRDARCACSLIKWTNKLLRCAIYIIINPTISRLVIVTTTPLESLGRDARWDRLIILNPRVVDDTDSYLMFTPLHIENAHFFV